MALKGQNDPRKQLKSLKEIGENSTGSFRVRDLCPSHQAPNPPPPEGQNLWWHILGDRTLTAMALRSAVHGSHSHPMTSPVIQASPLLPPPELQPLSIARGALRSCGDRGTDHGLKMGTSSISWYHMSPGKIGRSRGRHEQRVREGGQQSLTQFFLSARQDGTLSQISFHLEK